MAETGSTRVRRRINTLFASISTQGRTACSALTTTGHPSPPTLSHSRRARYTVRLRGTGLGKLLCRASADSNNPPPPHSPPFSASHQRQAGTLCYTTGYSARGRLQAGLALTVADLPSPPSITQSPLTRGKKRRKRRAARGTCAKEAWQSGAATW